MLATAAAAALIAVPAGAASTTYYDAVPDPLPSNVASLGYTALSTSEFGQLVTPASTGPLSTATVTMSSWACETGLWQNGDCATTPGSTFDHPVTVNLYEVDDAGTEPAVGALLGTVTQTVSVPYRPSVESTCPDINETDKQYPSGYFASDLGRCTDGYAFNATFDLSGLGLTLDGPVIVAVAYNTNNYGEAPIGSPGPYDALNVGIDVDPTTEPAVGAAGDNFWDATYLGRTPGLSNVGDWDYDVMVRLGYDEPVPTTADDCKDGGFEGFGFRNQGQCVASVKASENAGK